MFLNLRTCCGCKICENDRLGVHSSPFEEKVFELHVWGAQQSAQTQEGKQEWGGKEAGAFFRLLVLLGRYRGIIGNSYYKQFLMNIKIIQITWYVSKLFI